MADWGRHVNRLRALLGSIFPGLEAAFDYTTRSALILLTGFCTPDEVCAASHDGLTGHGAWRKGINAMAAPPVTAAEDQTVTAQVGGLRSNAC
ncbi:hypothetical protein GCM10022254_51240 [Actinomadura meridiana]|uniref:Transposase n=1 Tax=Actinomadura meridiana TaxID=559626 RepID=A0ABP8CD25_9ACTN